MIALANQKGGVGKTTTSINLGACLADLHQRVLLIDLDPQGNATSGLGIDKRQIGQNVYDVLINDVPLKDVITKSSHPGLDIVPTTIALSGAEVELTSLMARETRLKDAFGDVSDHYDFILIDCPPSLGLLTINAFTAANSILIPVQSEYYALEGLSQLMNTIQLVRKHFNKGLKIEGVLLTMYDRRTKLGKQVNAEVQKYFGSQVYHTIVPRNVRLSEAPSHGEAIVDYDRHSTGAQVYRQLAKEVLAAHGKE